MRRDGGRGRQIPDPVARAREFRRCIGTWESVAVSANIQTLSALFGHPRSQNCHEFAASVGGDDAAGPRLSWFASSRRGGDAPASGIGTYTGDLMVRG